MWSWWDSLETVSTVNVWARSIGAVLTGLAALCGLFILLSGRRVDTLKESRDKLTGEQTAERERALKDRVDAAESIAGSVRQDLTAAQDKQRESELALTELAAGVAPRIITNPQKAVSQLKQFSGVRVELTHFNNDECAQIARQISEIMKSAGLSVGGPSWTGNPKPTSDGIEIQYNAKVDDPAFGAALTLFGALLERDLACEIREANQTHITTPEGSISVIVGLRPTTHVLTEKERESRKADKTAKEARFAALQKQYKRN